MLRLFASDPLFAEWDELLTMYAQMLNPACFCNLYEVDTDSVEYKADVVIWEQQVEDKFAETKRLKWWADWLAK